MWISRTLIRILPGKVTIQFYNLEFGRLILPHHNQFINSLSILYLQKMSLPPSLHYNTVNQSGTFNSCCIIIQNAIWKCGTNRVRPSKIFRARSYRGTANILVQRNIKHGRRTHALIKFLISSTVWVRFILQTILVPSANRIWTLVVGSD